jgi:hypothetical protein
MLVLMGPGSDPEMFRELAAVTANGTVDPHQVLPILKRFGAQPVPRDAARRYIRLNHPEGV